MKQIGQNRGQESGAREQLKVLEGTSLFNKTGNLVLYKKSERICAASFVVSDSITPDSLRERVREEALNVFTCVRDAIGRRGTLLPVDADAAVLAAVSLSSVLELAWRIGEITESNYRTMRRECFLLAESISDVVALANSALDEGIFETGLPEAEAERPSAAGGRDRSSGKEADREAARKGQVKDISKKEDKIMSFKGSAKDLLNSLNSSIEDRETKIIEILKTKDRASIKDIIEAMDGVGEKTVQRALVSLVSRGVLKKEGERRWSRYALAQATLAV